MQTILLAILGVVLLVFCIVDLWHLRQMLKTMQNMCYFLDKIEGMDRERFVNGK